MEVWDIKKIQEVLPQKYPFLFVDKVIDIDREKGKVVCLKNVTINDYFFKGHFPNNPVMPGVIIIEALAQAAIIGFSALKPEVAEKKPKYYLGKVNMRFLNPVFVGDKLILEIYREKFFSSAGIVKAIAKVNENIVAEGELFFAIKLEDGK